MSIKGVVVITVTASAILSPPARGSVTNSASLSNVLTVNHSESMII